MDANLITDLLAQLPIVGALIVIGRYFIDRIDARDDKWREAIQTRDAEWRVLVTERDDQWREFLKEERRNCQENNAQMRDTVTEAIRVVRDVQSQLATVAEHQRFIADWVRDNE